MEDKLDTILKNQEIINKNQKAIYKELLFIEHKLKKADDREFIINYVADLAGTATNKLGLNDILDSIKAKK